MNEKYIKIIGIEAETLTPFAYHSLMVQSGTATLPELISDRAICFGLASTLGIMSSSVALPEKNYKQHMMMMPYRASVFMTHQPVLLPPVTRRLNLDTEGGFPRKIQDVAKKGNLKDFFYTQEVPPFRIFQGCLFGLENFDPFEITGQTEIVIRIGLHRNGMVKLTKSDVNKVRLNASTAALFNCELSVNRYCLHSLQLSPFMDSENAKNEVMKWK